MIHRDPKDAPRESGVYKLYSGETCIYVGSSRNIRARLLTHEHRPLCDGWEWMIVPEPELPLEEWRLMRQFNPPLNIFGRRIDLTPLLDPKVLAAMGENAAFVREKLRVTIHRACVEYLQRNGHWPPKEKSPQP